MGQEVETFEADFAKSLGSRYAVMANSGSSANLLIIAALAYHSRYRLQTGDEILVPAVSWSTTYAPLHQYGLPIRFVDVDPQTLNIDICKVEAAITNQTRALFAVNLLGNPIDYSILDPLLEKHNIMLIEDNCESLGAKLNDRHTGTFGIAGSHSCYFSHHISTMEGGIVTTDDEELYQLMLSIRAHGWTRNLPHNNLITSKLSNNSFNESFRFILPGYNLRPLEISGAIGCEQIRKLQSIVSERRKNAKLFCDVMHSYPEFSIQCETGESSWFGFSMVIREEVSLKRSMFVKILSKAGIECRPIVAGNFARNEVVTKYIDHSIYGNLHHADHLDRQGLFIGNHHYSLHKEMDLLDQTLCKFFAR